MRNSPLATTSFNLRTLHKYFVNAIIHVDGERMGNSSLATTSSNLRTLLKDFVNGIIHADGGKKKLSTGNHLSQPEDTAQGFRQRNHSR